MMGRKLGNFWFGEDWAGLGWAGLVGLGGLGLLEKWCRRRRKNNRIYEHENVLGGLSRSSSLFSFFSRVEREGAGGQFPFEGVIIYVSMYASIFHLWVFFLFLGGEMRNTGRWGDTPRVWGLTGGGGETGVPTAKSFFSFLSFFLPFFLPSFLSYFIGIISSRSSSRSSSRISLRPSSSKIKYIYSLV